MSVSNIMQTLGDHHRVLMAERIPQIHIFSSDTVEVQFVITDENMHVLVDSSSDPNIELDISKLHPNTTYTGILQFTAKVESAGLRNNIVRIQPRYSLDAGTTFVYMDTRQVAKSSSVDIENGLATGNISIPFSFTTTHTPNNMMFHIQVQTEIAPDVGINVAINSTGYNTGDPDNNIDTRPPFQLICFH